MNPSPKVRRILLGIALLLLIGLAWTGLSGGIHQLSQSTTVGEKAQTLTQFAYGVFALLSAATAFRDQCGDRPVVRGTASLIALGIVWLLDAGARSLTSGEHDAQ